MDNHNPIPYCLSIYALIIFILFRLEQISWPCVTATTFIFAIFSIVAYTTLKDLNERIRDLGIQAEYSRKHALTLSRENEALHREIQDLERKLRNKRFDA
jgi:cell division protein FtsL